MTSENEDDHEVSQYPLHPRKAMWSGQHTPSEQKLIREWIDKHPEPKDGKRQLSLFTFASYSKKQVINTVSSEQVQTMDRLHIERSCMVEEKAMAMRATEQLLQNLGSAAMVEVRNLNGIPTSVCVHVESRNLQHWSGFIQLSEIENSNDIESMEARQKSLMDAAIIRLTGYLQHAFDGLDVKKDTTFFKQLAVRIAYHVA